MSNETKIPKKYMFCSVPNCTNTTISTPNKLFIDVPKTKDLREQWFTLAGRSHVRMSVTSAIHFCEDHFDLPNDMENYMHYHVMGFVRKVLLKPGCLPSKFLCNTDRKRSASPPSTYEVTASQKPRVALVKEEVEEEENMLSTTTDRKRSASPPSTYEVTASQKPRVALVKEEVEEEEYMLSTTTHRKRSASPPSTYEVTASQKPREALVKEEVEEEENMLSTTLDIKPEIIETDEAYTPNEYDEDEDTRSSHSIKFETVEVKEECPMDNYCEIESTLTSNIKSEVVTPEYASLEKGIQTDKREFCSEKYTQTDNKNPCYSDKYTQTIETKDAATSPSTPWKEKVQDHQKRKRPLILRKKES